MFAQIDHVGVAVEDLDAAIALHERTYGLALAYREVVEEQGVEAVLLDVGASHVERHFTLDRTWKGTDHAASLEPDGLRRLNRNLFYTAEALQPKESELLAIEEPQRTKLKWQKS